MKLLITIILSSVLFISCADQVKYRTEVVEKHGNGKNRLIHRFKKINGGRYKLSQIKEFNRSGYLIRIEDLEHNRVKIALVDEKGHCSQKQEFVNGKRDGMWIKWNSGGWVESKTMYKEGKLHGKHRVFNAKGELVYSAMYENGKKVEN